MFGTIKRKLLRKTRQETILKFYKLLAVPALLCVSKCWALTKKKELQQIEAEEMRFVRPVAGYRRIDQSRNEVLDRN
jgi:hypothetical protein